MSDTSINSNEPITTKWVNITVEEILDIYLPMNDPLLGKAVIGKDFVELSYMPQIEPFIEVVHSEVSKINKDEIDFNLQIYWPPEEDEKIDLNKIINFRVHRQNSIDGMFAILRKMPNTVPKLNTLGLNQEISNVFKSPHLKKGGLIVICGETGNGKSTTAAAIISERLNRFGGFCLTLENPVEMPLHGNHGSGFCLQSMVNEGGFQKALSSAMRCYPTSTDSILYIGEVRSSETASEALRVANNGHLVLTTIHSSNVMTALKRILTMATTKNMTEEESASLLSSSLKLVIHQKLEISSIDNKRRDLKISFLLSTSNQSPVANKIRGHNIDGLITEVEQQNQVLRVGKFNSLLGDWDKAKP